ncbi:MAG TPA: 2-hydroxy-acid oxidase [Actinoplanes sp.]|nr:2-hydroxy-acid oxidase [Actinoplanes sp.]
MTGMFVSGPVRAAGLGAVLTAAGRRTFEQSAAIALDPQHQARYAVYLSDMLQPYGLTPGDTGDGRGHSYGEMAQAVIAATVPPDEPVDLLVLAFAVPDVAPGRATATYLSHVCPGRPLAFAVCDNGAATAFTGLQIIGGYLASGACRSALLVVVEQADLHQVPMVAAPVPTMHTAVALRLTAADGARCTTEVRTADPAEVGGLLAAAVAQLSGGPGDALLLGPLLGGLAEVPVGARVGDAGRPYTGLWWELAGETAAGGPARRVVLADYDPRLRVLGLAAVDVGASGTADPTGPADSARRAGHSREQVAA